MSAVARIVEVCELSELNDLDCREFRLDEDDELGCFVVRRGAAVFAYRNSCPHLGVNLNWRPNGFLDLEQNHILCALHGALFNIDDGECVLGPCVGRSLEPLPARVVNGVIRVEVD